MGFRFIRPKNHNNTAKVRLFLEPTIKNRRFLRRSFAAVFYWKLLVDAVVYFQRGKSALNVFDGAGQVIKYHVDFALLRIT